MGGAGAQPFRSSVRLRVLGDSVVKTFPGEEPPPVMHETFATVH